METTKPWYLSKTVWGVIIAFVAMLTKNIFNINLPDFSAEVVEIIGLCLALYGRIKAATIIS